MFPAHPKMQETYIFYFQLLITSLNTQLNIMGINYYQKLARLCPCGFCYLGKTKRELKTRITVMIDRQNCSVAPLCPKGRFGIAAEKAWNDRQSDCEKKYLDVFLGLQPV